MKLLEDATKIMCLKPGSNDFVEEAMFWLSAKKQDIHVEFMRGSGWSVSCCYEDPEWKDWTRDMHLAYALAKAIKLVASHEKIQVSQDSQSTLE